MKTKINNNLAPQAKRLCGAMKRAALALLLCVLTTMTAWAENVTLTSSTTEWTNGNTYILNSNVTITQRIMVTGHVTLQLNSGCTLTATRGIKLDYDETTTPIIKGVLTINGSGTLDIPEADLQAGEYGIGVINSCELHIEGGTINAHAGAGTAGIRLCDQHGKLFISGGTVNAWHGEAYNTVTQPGVVDHNYIGSAIGADGAMSETGGSYQGWDSYCGNITISGGTVNAHGDIGDQYKTPTLAGVREKSTCTITILGGTINIDEYYLFWCHDLILDYNASTYSNFHINQPSGANPVCPNVGNVHLAKPFIYNNQQITHLDDINALKDHTITPINNPPAFYSLTRNNPDHGTVETQIDGGNTDWAFAGQTVAVVTKPDENYQTGSVTVTGATLNSDNTFTMPANNVSVSATFSYFPHPWSGSGTASDPFIIHTVTDLQNLATNVNNGTSYDGYYFEQDIDIDCRNYTMTPIGSFANNNRFGGKYNGGNHLILNFKCHPTGNSNGEAALFGATKHDVNASVSYIEMVYCDIDATGTSSSTNYAAGICVYCGRGTTISHCSVSGTIKGNTAAGGIVSTTYDGSVTLNNCFTDVIVNGTGYKGKVIGATSQHLTVSNCRYHDNGDGVGVCGYDGSNIGYTTNEIVPLYTVSSNSLKLIWTATFVCGETLYFPNGAAATLRVNDEENTFIYGTPTVSGTGATFELAADRKRMTVTVGSSDVTVNATVRSISGTCGTNATWSLAQDGNGDYTLLTISGTGAVQNYSQNSPAPWGNAITIANVGDGITGIGDYAFANCSSLQRVNINNSGAVSIGSNTFSGCTALQYIVFPSIAAEQQNTTGNWEAYATKRRAQFGSQHFAVTTETGTAVYAIATEQDLRYLSTAVNGGNNGSGQTFRQTADITLNGTFTPIANIVNSSTTLVFKGTYDGGDHTISNLTISGNHQYASLFGNVGSGATVKNVRLVSPSVTSSYNSGTYVAALIADAQQSTVQNCLVVNPNVSATSSSSDNEVGALIGSLSNATVQNCFVINPTVSGAGTNAVGVICGSAHSGGNTIFCTLNNVYYYNSSLPVYGSHTGGVMHLTNVGPARKVTLGSGMASVSPAATEPANGFVYDNVSYYREGLQLTLTDNLGDSPEGYSKHYFANGTDLEGTTYTVSSTDGDATLIAAFRSDGQSHEVTYVDANGTPHTANAILLDGYETITQEYGTNYVLLNQGCYYVGTDITYTNTIKLQGNVTIILGNGKTMTSQQIYYNNDLTIYGQSLDNNTAGTLLICNSYQGIYNVNSYTQHSGNVSINCDSPVGSYGINANRVTLNGGKLTINVHGSNPNAIYASVNITINGGQLDATNSGWGNSIDLYANSGNITLGWTNATDYIHANSYSARGTVSVKDGLVFVTDDDTPVTVSGTISDMSLINGKTLTPKLVGSGTTDDPYLITNVGGWDLFCDLVQNSTYTFQGNVKLGADISVSRMAGSESKPFAGNFDGQDYTLTFNCNTSDDYVAPFRYVIGGIGNVTNHATISNLNVVSTINGSTHLAGLIANQQGLVDLTNCHVTATIASTATTASYCAGLVSHAAMRDPSDQTGYGNANDGTLTISGCTVSGSISTYGSYAGGFVGMAEGKTSIVNSSSSVTINSFVSGNGTHGGFIGLQQDTFDYANVSTNVSTTIEGCLFNGKLITSNSTTNCGGFIGWHDGGELEIKHCLYAPAAIVSGETEISDGYTFVGNGTVGDNCIYTRALGTAQGKATHNITAGDNVTISNMALINFLSNPAVYNVSGITSYDWDGISCGGNLYICEGAHVSLVLSNDYPDPAPAGSVYGYTATAGTLSGIANPYTLTMPDDNVIINVDTEHPVALDWSGTGTENDPYMIYNKEQLDLVASRMYHDGYNYGPDQDYQTHPDGYFFKLGADIVYPYTNSTVNNFIPIGNTISFQNFQGTFDGDGHTISGIRINVDYLNDNYYTNGFPYGYGYYGLFGESYGTVKNVILADAIITGAGNIGGIAGNNGGTITNCHVAADVVIQANDDYTYTYGGIAGDNYHGTINHCTSAATITIPDDAEACEYIGGIAGSNSGTLSDNLVIGATIPASDDNSHGAICGDNSGTLEHNYYVGCTVGGTPNAIGVGCGSIEDGDDYITADITANDDAVPGNKIILAEHVTSDATVFTIPAYGEMDEQTFSVAAFGATVTLGYELSGYVVYYLVDETPIEGNTFTMPNEYVEAVVVMVGEHMELAAGWNWWAPRIEINRTVLDGLNDSQLIVKSKNGTITEGVLVPGQMYKIWTSTDGELTVAGVASSNVIVTINSGYNWFGFIGHESAEIGTVFNTSFGPAEGDKIISQDGGFAIYTVVEGVGSWQGTLATLVPGRGYVYVSKANQSKTLTF